MERAARQGRTTGQLHNETAYGLVKFVDGGTSQVVVRKPLSALKIPKDLDSVRDPTLREALQRLWFQIGLEGGNAPVFAERAATEGVRLNGKVQRVKRVRVVQNLRVVPISSREDPAGKPYKGYKADSNEFAVIWEGDGKWKIVAVPSFYANQPNLDLSKFRPHPTAKRTMRLHKNDMGALGTGAERHIVVVRKFSVGRVILDDHNEADIDGRERRAEMDRNKSIYSATRLLKEGFRKIGVDEIGRVLDPGPRST